MRWAYRHAKGGGLQECSNGWDCKDFVEHVFFDCASYNFRSKSCLNSLRQLLTLGAFEVFVTVAFSTKLCFV